MAVYIHCTWCHNEFDPLRETPRKRMNGYRCPECGEEHDRTDVQEKTQTDIKSSMSDGVYLISNNSGQYKIGISSRPRERVKQLQTGNPHELEIVYYNDNLDAKRVESYLHDEFRQENLSGEWFDLSEDQKLDVGAFITAPSFKSPAKQTTRQ